MSEPEGRGTPQPGAGRRGRRRDDVQRALRSYPEAWRRRYGAELAALIEDCYGEGPVPWRCRLGLLQAGLAERLRGSGLLGGRASPSEGARAGALLVLCAWAVCVVAGAGFANRADNWAAAVPAGGRRLPLVGYDLVYAGGLAGCAIVVLAAVACLPSVAAFLRAGGWPAIRHRVLQAAALLLMTAAGLAALKAWSVRLDAAQRNGGVWGYSALFVVTALVSAAAIGAGTAAIVATVRRVDLPPRVLRFCGGLAVTLTTAMTALAGGTVIWWAAMAAVAPGSLGGPAAAPGVGIPSLMVIVGLLMVLGLAGGVAGAWRVITSLRRMA